MKIIGCDFHPSFQQMALVDTETGEPATRDSGFQKGYTRNSTTVAPAPPSFCCGSATVATCG